MDFDGNLRRIIESIEIARQKGASYRVSKNCCNYFLNTVMGFSSNFSCIDVARRLVLSLRFLGMVVKITSKSRTLLIILGSAYWNY